MSSIEKIIILIFCITFSIGTVVVVIQDIYSIFKKEKTLKFQLDEKVIFPFRKFRVKRKRRYYRNHK